MNIKNLYYFYLKAAVEKIFTCDDGSEYDYVFNLAAETKYGQSEGVRIRIKKKKKKGKLKFFLTFLFLSNLFNIYEYRFTTKRSMVFLSLVLKKLLKEILNALLN